MRRHQQNDEEDDFDDEDPGFEEYYGPEDEEPTIDCPYCGHEIHENSNRCPGCERYISKEDAPPRPKPWWLLVGVAVCLYAVYKWIAG